MIEKMQVYKCQHCGIVAQVLSGGGGEMICCGEPMKQLVENTVDAAREKHVPVVEKIDGGIKVLVGSVAHPMTEEHYIGWIELIAGTKRCIHFLKPGDAPETTFECECASGEITIRAYCNLHGLWKA